MTKEFPMTNAEFSLITRASGGESRGLPSRRQRGFHRLATLCWERIGHWGHWSFTGHCGIGHWSFAPNAKPLEMSRSHRVETSDRKTFGLQRLLGSHPGDQAIVQFSGRIVTGELELGLKSGHFDEPCQIPPGAHRDRNMRDIYTQDFDEFIVHPETVHIRHFVPQSERDH